MTLAYARLSNHDHKEDLVRQVALLESFCSVKGWVCEVHQDLGSGLRSHKKSGELEAGDISHAEAAHCLGTGDETLLRLI